MRTAPLLLLALALSGCKTATAPDVTAQAPALDDVRVTRAKPASGPPTLSHAAAYVDGDTLRIVAQVDRAERDLNRSWTFDGIVWTDAGSWAIGWLPELALAPDAAMFVWDYQLARVVGSVRVEQHGRRLEVAAPLVVAGVPQRVSLWAFAVNPDGTRGAFSVLYSVPVSGEVAVR